MNPTKIKIRKKGMLQVESDIYVVKDGPDMCQPGGVSLIQKDFCGDVGTVRFHQSDIPRLIEALKGEILTLSDDNCTEFNEWRVDFEKMR